MVKTIAGVMIPRAVLLACAFGIWLGAAACSDEPTSNADDTNTLDTSPPLDVHTDTHQPTDMGVDAPPTDTSTDTAEMDGADTQDILDTQDISDVQDVPDTQDVSDVPDVPDTQETDAPSDTGSDVPTSGDVIADILLVCGDGVITLPEICDDLNVQNGDGCSSACEQEPDYLCDGEPSNCVRVDDCIGNGCINGGVCVDGIDAYSCSCSAGYTGDLCETNIDDCTPNPCLNASACIDAVDSFTCQCSAGYTGDLCETDIDDCTPNPCLHAGTCTDEVDGFTCQCSVGYEGLVCADCAANTADCNADDSDGCEVNLQSSAAHCGGCGDPCPAMQICSQSICQSPPTGQIPGTPIHVDVLHGPLAPWIADVNRDGYLDILVANGESGSATTPSGSLSVFHGNGDGTLRGELYYTGAPLSSNAVVAVDVDGDGWLDAVTVDGQTNLAAVNGAISVYLNSGASGPGTFGTPTSFTTGAPGSIHLCAGDLNGDGHADIATTNVVTNQVSILFNTGTGDFAAPTLISILATGGVQSSIACRDLNGDDFVDLVVTSPSSARLSVLLNQGNGTFAAPVAYTNSMNGQTAGIAFGDADNDGLIDILSNGAAGRYLFFFRGNGNGTFLTGAASTVSASAIANSALGVVADDFNGDGDLDAYVLQTTSSGGVRPLTGDGTGAFTAGTLVSTGTSPGLNAIAVGDMDRSGYSDLVLTNRGSNTLSVIPNGL